MGRPKGSGLYRPEYDRMAYIACVEGGFTIVKLGKLFGVSKQTIHTWKNENKSFLDSIRQGTDEFNCMTAEKCLLKRITGFRHTEKTQEPKISIDVNGDVVEQKMVTTKIVIKSIAPDPTSIIFFLRNRNRERWPDIRTNENTGKDGGPVELAMSIPEAILEMIKYERKD